MTMIEKIKAEIERRLKRENEILWNAKLRGTYPSPSCEYNLLTLTSLRDFIDTLEPEKPMNQDELEKELDRYLHGEFQQTAGGNFNNYIQVARHFAEWGAEHLKK